MALGCFVVLCGSWLFWLFLGFFGGCWCLFVFVGDCCWFLVILGGSL